MSAHKSTSIFTGITILDLTKVFSGPLATRYFADYGARVIKIENQRSPDPARAFPPLRNGMSGYFEILNRNKESLCLDLKSPADLHTFYELVKKADIVVENMTPSAKHNLKIDYGTLKKINPRLIYASLAGKDQNSDEKYFDIIAQAESGLMTLSGTKDHPTKIGPSVVDAFSGINLAFALAAALYDRKQSGHGQNVTLSMLGLSMNLLEQNLIEYTVTRKNPLPPGNQDTAIAPFGIYRAQNGSVVLAIGSAQIWDIFVAVFDKQKKLLQHFSDNTIRLKKQSQLTKNIERLFAHYTVDKLVTIGKEHGIPIAKIATMADVAHNQWFYEQGALQEVNHPELGKIVVPGVPIKFSNYKKLPYRPATPIQETSAYTFSPLSKRNHPQIVKLLADAFTMKAREKSQFVSWKLWGNLKGPAANLVAYGAYDGKNLVSFYCNKHFPLVYKKTIMKSGICLDMATDPAHRGKGLISQLSKRVYAQRQTDHFVFSFGFSNAQGVKVDKYASGYGYSVIGKFKRYVALSRPKQSQYIWEHTDTLVDSKYAPSLLHVPYTTQFLQWRYSNHPSNQYLYVNYMVKNQLTAQVIIKRGGWWLDVVNIIPHRSVGYAEILSALRGLAWSTRRFGVKLSVLPNAHWEQSLGRAGYHPFQLHETEYYLTVKALGKPPQKFDIFDADNWLLMSGDIL